ncbi:MAG: hypothetical protein J0L53_13165, partial [Spirochaetes bacterium]|nr:hypothetical protein [Spirochaetota bacterium]
DVKSLIREFADDAVNVRIEQLLPGKKVSEYNFDALAEYLNGVFQIKYDNLEDAVRGVSKDEFIASIRKQALDAFNRKEEEIGAENMRILEKMIALQVIDQKWKDHLYLMDQLRDGIWTLGYAERNPLVEYRFRAFAMFEDMVAAVKDEVTEFILKAQVKEQLHEEEAIEAEYHEVGSAQHNTMAGFDMTDGVAAQPEEVGRPARVELVAGGQGRLDQPVGADPQQAVEEEGAQVVAGGVGRGAVQQGDGLPGR